MKTLTHDSMNVLQEANRQEEVPVGLGDTPRQGDRSVIQNPDGGTGLCGRRSFVKGLAWSGAGALATGLAAGKEEAKYKGLTRGDAAILRFLAAAEILETDLWQQYNELAGVQDAE